MTTRTQQIDIERALNPEAVGFLDPATGALIDPTVPAPAAVVGDVATGTLTIAANAGYVSGDLIANHATAGSVVPITLAAARAVDKWGGIVRTRLSINDANWAGLIVRVHFYQNSPTFAVGDSVAISTTRSGYLGYMEVTLDRTFSDAVEGIAVAAVGPFIGFLPASGTRNIFAVLESRSSITATAGKIFTVEAEVVG